MPSFCGNRSRSEIYESRTYRLLQGPETLLYLTDLVTSRQHALGLLPEDVGRGVAELLRGTAFKFLSKRRKDDGLIAALLVAAGLNSRSLLGRLDWAPEDEYRQAVAAFETGFLPAGIIAPPLVITLEEWRRYAHERPFSETPFRS